ncbi:MAG: sigma-54 dependent transcriptional regulator [Candidatus Polarisedimenticolia bacterium]|nr:sigma-54 dependent transcriptional regulator [bacterium]
MAVVLVVDDERGIREMLAAALEADGHRVLAAASGEAALETLAAEPVDLLLTDLAMPGIDGVELLRRAAEIAPDTPSIVVTAYGTKESAIEAMRHGAVNYLEKPFDIEEMGLHVRRALGMHDLSLENRRLKARLAVSSDLAGHSPAIRAVRELIERVAPTDATVLFTGESGSGKEIAARALHRASRRAEKPLVSINCAAIPPDLLESELFGHVRGAFTGADRSRAGLVESAAGGTLLLDEIGDMPAAMQAKLLRVLQERRIRRVGGAEEIPVDVRIVAATHQDLESLVADGRFRGDLYYRINVIRVHLPSLRERMDDLPDLVESLVARAAERMGRRISGTTPGFVAALARHSWPGNVRELENVLERAVALAAGDHLGVETLPPELLDGGERRLEDGALPDGFDLEAHLDAERRTLMAAALAASGGVQKRAAERLGMTFRSFRYFAKKFGLAGKSGDEGGDEDET